MWFASIWIFTLQLPWQLGADLFYRHLLDGDPASNTLSWRWVAGLHTPGKTYLASSSNIARYTDNRFDPSGQLAENAPALSETRVFPLRDLPPEAAAPTAGPFGLLVTEEDASPETLPIQAKPRAVLGVVAPSMRSPLPVSSGVEEFTTAAVTDALRRATQHFAVDGQFAATEDWSNLLIEWATQNGLKTVVTAYAPVGPVADLLGGVREQLEERGIGLVQTWRPYDRVTWPHAKRGYFKLRQEIPMLLEALGIRGVDEPLSAQSKAG